MATYTSTSGNYKTTLTVTETATSIPNNTSTLSWSLKVERIGGASYQYGIYNGNQCPWSVSINGSTVGSGTFSYDFRYTDSYNLGSGNNVTVAHNNDGTKTGVAVSGTVDLDNSAYVSVMTASGTIDLTTIPRASDISLSVGSYNVTSSSGNAFTYTITAKSTSFYNRLRYTLGSTNYMGSGSTGSRSGNFTNSELLNSLPTATSGSLTAYVDTATDSGFTNIIGTNSVSIPISINTSYIKPSITLKNLSVNNSPISGYAVAGYSKVQCGNSSNKWSASGGYGSNAITVTFTTSHGSLAQSSYSASSNSISNYTVTNVLPSSSSNYTLTISATARDSRGATSSASKTYTVYGYTPPTANLTAYRVASSSSTTEDGAGTYAYVTFSGAVSSSVNSQNTIQSTTCTYSGSISGTATSGGHYALADTQTVTFTLTVTDKVTSSTSQKTISTASYPLDLYDDGNGNVGVGVGTVAEANVLKSSLIMKVNASSANVETKDTNNNGNCFIGWGSGHQNHGVYSHGYSPDGTSWTANGKWIVYRDGNGDITLNGNALTATRANNATYVDWTETNPTSTTPYWIPFGAEHSTNTTNRGLLSNDGLVYRTREGTATEVGYAILEVGNSINQGIAGNKYGSVRLRSATTDKYSDLACRSSEANNNTCWLPGAPQGVALEGTRQLWAGTKNSSANDSGTSIPNLALYKRARFYAIYKGNASMIWDADVTKIVALNKECEANHTELSYMSWSGGSGYYQTFFKVSLTPSGNNMTLKFTEVRNFSVPYTGSTGTEQTGSEDYYIYRVDGVVGF